MVSLAFSVDGKRLACGDSGGGIHIFDITGQHAPHAWQAHEQRIEAITFSSDGKMLVSAGNDQQVKVWEVDTWRLLRAVHGENRELAIRCLAVSPDSNTLCYGGKDRRLIAVDLASGRQRFSHSAQRLEVRAIAFSPNGRWIVSAGRDTSIRIWDAGTGQLTFVVPAHMLGVWGLAFSPDGRTLASVGTAGRLKLWDFERIVQPKIAVDNLPGGALLEVGFSADGRCLATRSSTGAVTLWDVPPSGTPRNRADLGRASALAQSADGGTIAILSDGKIRIWQSAQQKIVNEFDTNDRDAQPVGAAAISLSTDGRLVAVGNSENAISTIRVWDTATGIEQLFLSDAEPATKSLSFSADGRLLIATAGPETPPQAWNLASGERLSLSSELRQSASYVTFAPNAPLLATVSREGVIQVWEFDRTSCRLLWRHHLGGAQYVAFCSDKVTVAAGGPEGIVKLWNQRSGRELLTLHSGLTSLHAIAFSQDGMSLVAAGESPPGQGAFRIWHAQR